MTQDENKEIAADIPNSVEHGVPERNWMHPGLVLPLLSIYFYVIASTYLGSYLRFFGAENHWFAPDLFQLIAFSWSAIVGTALAVGFLGILRDHATIEWKLWTLLWGCWCAVLVHLHLRRYSALVTFNPRNESAITETLITLVTWMMFPVLWRMADKKRASKAKAACEDSARTGESKEGEISSSESATLRHSSPLESVFLRYLPLATLAWWIWMSITAISWLGFSSAKEVYNHGRFLNISHSDSGQASKLIFTDGVLSLVMKRDGGSVFTFLYSNQFESPIELGPPSEEARHFEVESKRRAKQLQEMLDQSQAIIEWSKQKIQGEPEIEGPPESLSSMELVPEEDESHSYDSESQAED